MGRSTSRKTPPKTLAKRATKTEMPTRRMTSSATHVGKEIIQQKIAESRARSNAIIVGKMDTWQKSAEARLQEFLVKKPKGRPRKDTRSSRRTTRRAKPTSRKNRSKVN